MRILGVVGALERYGGAELSFLALVRGLARRGHQIDVVHFIPDGSLYEEFAAVCTSIRQAREEGDTAEVELAAVPDLVYAAFPAAAPFGAACAAPAGAPLVCRLNVPPERADVGELRDVGAVVDIFMAASGATRNRWVEAGLRADKVVVVHNGVDTEQFGVQSGGRSRKALGVGDDDFALLFAGRLEAAKGIEVLLDAWRICRRSERDRLLVAGEPYAPSEPAMAQAYMDHLVARQPQGVMWLGQRADMPDLYAAADVVVVPSTWPEPLARSLLEAMACGRPVLASAVGGLPEVLTPPLDRLLVRPGDPHALAAAIDGMRDWHWEEPDLGAQCRQAVLDRFTLDHHLDAVERVFRGALAGTLSARSTRS